MTKELYFVDTLVSVNYIKTLPLCLYESIQIFDESFVTNIALGFTGLSSQAVYFIQTGGSAVSNTYSTRGGSCICHASKSFVV